MEFHSSAHTSGYIFSLLSLITRAGACENFKLVRQLLIFNMEADVWEEYYYIYCMAFLQSPKTVHTAQRGKQPPLCLAFS